MAVELRVLRHSGVGYGQPNLIPFSAVDRIEVVADGASAIYGSDAIAGVVNVILKQNYDGLNIRARMGDRDRDDGTEESYLSCGDPPAIRAA